MIDFALGCKLLAHVYSTDQLISFVCDIVAGKIRLLYTAIPHCVEQLNS